MAKPNVSLSALEKFVLGIVTTFSFLGSLAIGAYCIYLIGVHPSYQMFLFNPFYLLFFIGIIFGGAIAVALVVCAYCRAVLVRRQQVGAHSNGN